MGGVLGVLLAERCQLRGLVNVEGNLSQGDCAYSGPVASQDWHEFLSTGRGVMLDQIYLRGIQDRAHRGYYASLCLAQPESIYRHSQDLIRLSTQESMVSRLEALKVPVLYLGGARGGVCDRSVELLSKSTLSHHLLDEAGHWPFLDQPSAFAGRLSQWLESLP